MCQTCEHAGAVHNTAGCRVTGCECKGLVEPPEPDVPKPTHRRVCVDVPDGYSVTFTVTPGAVDG